jgi:predicted Na+-dependent transporter
MGPGLTPLDVVALICLLLLMVGLGATIDTDAFKCHFKRPKSLLIGMFLQFIVQPPLSLAVSKIFRLPPLQSIALVVVCSCPGGSMSNIICVVMRADVDLSVAMTAASSLAALFMLPLNVYLYGGLVNAAEDGEGSGGSADVKMDFASILLSTLIVIVGTMVGYKIKVLGSERLVAVAAKVGVVSGVLVLVNSFRSNLQSDTPVYKAEGRFIAACVSQVFLSLAVGLLCSRALAKLPGPSCMSIATETSTQNTIIALSILSLSLVESDAAAASIIPIIYGTTNTWTNVVFGLFAWKVLGWSNMGKEATLREMWSSYKELLKVQQKVGPGLAVVVADGGDGGGGDQSNLGGGDETAAAAGSGQAAAPARALTK